MSQPALLPRLLTAPNAARYLGMSPSKLRTLEIPRKEHGGNKLYDRQDLDAFADNLRYEGGEASATTGANSKPKPKQWMTK